VVFLFRLRTPGSAGFGRGFEAPSARRRRRRRLSDVVHNFFAAARIASNDALKCCLRALEASLTAATSFAYYFPAGCSGGWEPRFEKGNRAADPTARPGQLTSLVRPPYPSHPIMTKTS